MIQDKLAGKGGARYCRIVAQASGTAQLQAGGPVRELSLPGGQLEHSAAGSGEGRVPLRRVVPPRRLHPDLPHGGGPGRWCGSTTSAAPHSSGSKKVGAARMKDLAKVNKHSEDLSNRFAIDFGGGRWYPWRRRLERR
jgi:hypothetical protein